MAFFFIFSFLVSMQSVPRFFLSVILVLLVSQNCIAQNCVLFNLTNVVLTKPDCKDNRGSITGITATGAVSYRWIDDFGNVVSTSLNLVNASAGTYQLVGITADGCENSTLVTLPPGGTPINGYLVYGINTSCGANNGSFHIVTANSSIPEGIRWVDAQNNTVGTDVNVYGLSNGIYRLYLKNKEGCEVIHTTASLTSRGKLDVSFGDAFIKNDTCNRSIGAVNGLKIISGVNPILVKWFDEQQNVVSTNLNLNNVSAGKYKVLITDSCGVDPFEESFEIINSDISLAKPNVADIKLCSPGLANIEVINPQIGRYRIYDSQQSPYPIHEGVSGSFEFQANIDRKVYVSFASGDCESERTEVDIAIGVSAKKLPNAISPNGDGVNDEWNLSWLTYYPAASAKIFNRLGQIVYSYNNQEMFFNGNRKGKALPVGTYYYIIELGKDCSLIRGTINIIR